MTQGWNCPNCGKAHAPHIETCPEPGANQDFISIDELKMAFKACPQHQEYTPGPPHTITCGTTDTVLINSRPYKITSRNVTLP